jgi:putative endonuclease
MYYLYILRCCDDSLYCGQTKNLEKRIEEHNKNKVKSSKYAWSHRPVKLVYTEKHKSLSDALKREIEIKKFSKIKKEKLIKNYEKNNIQKHKQ